MLKKLKAFFCQHKHFEVVCWHWMHPMDGIHSTIIETQLYCKDCKKYYHRYIYDLKDIQDFVLKYKDKQWSDTCKPVRILK